jgi:hypothetical protein
VCCTQMEKKMAGIRCCFLSLSGSVVRLASRL